jgi:excisionase family DNA binding protein
LYATHTDRFGGYQAGTNPPRPTGEWRYGKTASDFLKVPEAAEALGVSERTIRSWIATGHLPRIQPGGEHGAIRIDRRDLLRSECSEVER